MIRRLSLITFILLLAPALLTTPAEARRGFGGFGGGRSFSRPSLPRPTFSSRPRIPTPAPISPPRISTPPVTPPSAPSTLPPRGGFGGGDASGIAGAPKVAPAPSSVPPTGAFGGGDARGVAGANAPKPTSSRPRATTPDSGAPGTPGGSPTISRPGPAPGSGSVYRDYRRVEPVRGSPNVYVYDNRPFWGFMPFWWHPPIYSPVGAMVAPGGANPLAILLTLVVVGLVIAAIVSVVRRQ